MANVLPTWQGFNGVVASIISYTIRTYTWHTYRIYIDIQALQWSLLGGRVFFTGLRYHGENETILIQNGHITWSYWLRRARDAGFVAEKTSTNSEDGGISDANKRTELPCRINVVVSGLEWFVYNRSAAYDSILEAMTERPPSAHSDTVDGTEKPANGSAKPRQRLRKSHEKSDSYKETDVEINAEKDGLRNRQQKTFSSTSTADGGNGKIDKDDLPLMLQLFPIKFKCDKAALVMGNDSTKSILIVKAKSLTGEVDAAECQTPDPYRQQFEIQLDNPVVEMRENDGFKEEQLARAARDKQVATGSTPIQQRSFFRRQRRKVLEQLRNLVPYWRKSVESFSVNSQDGEDAPAEPRIPGAHQWQGLSRYLNEDDEDDKLRWSSVEYASVNTVVDSPRAELTMYWDVPGKVASDGLSHPFKNGDDLSGDINGTAAPAWAVKLSLQGGIVNYGPWADRQRAELQRVFFPGLSKDAVPARRLPPGADRVPTRFDFYLQLDREVILRVPTREDSKNWRWKKEAATLKQRRKEGSRRDRGRTRKSTTTTAAEQRPYGWLDIKIAANTSVSYAMDMLAKSTGYTNTLKIDLPSTEVSTSVNHGLLWRSESQQISCDLSTPLKWNGLRTWRFDIESDGLELFILRDHIFLLIDLIDDWGSGPPSEYLLFTPFKYLLNLRLGRLKLHLNVNDVNIVNDPTNYEENTYLILHSPNLVVDTCIPLDNYRPTKTAVPFRVTAYSLQLGLHRPPWNTQATFQVSRVIGYLENLDIEGKYHYNATTSPANTDTLVLDVSGQSPTVYLYGFLIRYLLQMKDNYFGDHIHFRTLDEHQEALRTKAADPEAQHADRPPHKKSNDLDVMLTIRADDPKVFLPANMYSAKRHIPIEAASLSVDLRFTNYYMDLEMNFSPLSLSLGEQNDGATSPLSTVSSTQLFIDGLYVYGHRLFGLPPSEPTYLCNWDLKVGSVTGDCSTDFLTTLIRGGKAFGFSFDDDENALIPYSSVVMYDVTFLRVFVESVQVWVRVDEAAFLFSTGTVDVNYNDWARTHYSRRADIKVPNLEIACVNSESATRHRSRLRSRVDADVLLRTNIHFALIGRKYDFAQERHLQQELVRRHDQRTHRTDFLLLPGLLDEFTPDPVDIPAQSIPPVPQPVSSGTLTDKKSVYSLGSSNRSGGPRRKSSFLSLGSSSNHSIIRQGSVRTNQRSRISDRNTSDPNLLKAGETRRPANSREYSASAGRYSGPFGASSEPGDRKDSHHTSITFSSQYFSPSFPLLDIRPDAKEAAMDSIEEDENDTLLNSSDFNLEDIDPDQLSQDSAHQSLLLELPTGISVFLNATSLRSIASLIRALAPSDPEDILDTLQIEAVTDIFDTQKQAKINGTITEFVVRLPQANLRFLNCSNLDSTDPSQEPQDQYDVSLKTLVLATRSGLRTDTTDNTPTNGDSRLSFHFRLASMQLSAAEKLTNLDQAQAAVLARIERVMVSMGSKEVNYIDADVGGVHISSSSGKVEYLASLIHRTNMLASETGELFTQTFSVAEDRLKQFTYRVITEGHQASDASFVVRPSAILRTAPQHLRTYDSWKLITRLRQMWFTLDPDAKETLRQECMFGFKQYPADARQQVTAAFEKWRSWDLEDPRHAVLLNNIFGKAPESKTDTSDKIPMMAVTRIQELQFVLDPGPKQNEIVVMDLTVRMQEKNSNNEEEQEEITGAEEPLTLINVYCSEAGIKTNWELCELVEDILRLHKRAESSVSGGSRPKQQDIAEHKPSRPLHVVFVLGEGAISLEAINLSARLQSTNLKLSILTTDGQRGTTNANLVLGCDLATLRVKSHSQVLATSQLQRPSVIIAHEVQFDKHSSAHTIKAAASSQDLEFIVRQDPIVLAEVLDLLVKDEVAQLYALGQGFPTDPRPAPEDQGGMGRLSSIRLNLAMFLDSYTITLPLLRSLTYTISGVVARANMAATFGKEIILDFDVKENSHDMQINVNNTPRSISLLQIPPTNGRITSHMAPGEHSVAVLASLELVELDASAVYSLLTALNRPEISNAIDDLQQQIRIIQEHIEEIFGSAPAEPAKPASLKSNDSKLTYVVHASLAGLKIWGIAPIKSDVETYARLSFCLDTVQIQLANRIDTGPILENPEIRINLRQILFDIEKGTREGMRSCGNLAFGALITATSHESEDGTELRSFDFKSDAFEVNLSSDTVSTFIDVLGYMGDKIKDIDTSRELEYLRKLRQSKPRIAINDEEQETESDILDSFLSSIMYSFEIRNIQLCWLVSTPNPTATGQEDLVLSFERIEFATRKKNSAKLTIEDFQLQMVPPGEDKSRRSQNSALLPEVIFNIAFVSTADARRLAFQAAGKSLDLRLTSAFIVPAAHLKDSISLSVNNVQQASEHWAPIVLPEKQVTKPAEQVAETRRSLFGSRRLESLLIDADFAGAVVYLCGKKPVDETAGPAGSKASRPTLAGKYGQFSTDETGSSTVLRSPGLAWKTEYRDNGKEDPTLYGEVKIDPSRNVLYPTIVPLIMDITSSIKEVVGDDAPESPTASDKSGENQGKTKSNDEDNILTTDPSAVLGRMKLNLGLRICKQEFTLSCQPIGRVAATARCDDIYITMNTVQGAENGNFFAISGTFSGFHTSVQHVYSRESTGSFGVDSIVLSMMNSKHVSGTSGLSAILKVSPMEVAINAKQLQDFLLFREIWIPGEIRQGTAAPVATVAAESVAQGHLVQRYQQVAATAAFPWTATISIAALNVVVDLGQSLGKSKFAISEFWVSSKKTSDWEQNLCLGFQRIGVDCTGRLSGFVALQNFKLRTSIEWPEREQALNETPRIQASISFSEFRLKIAFDYQAFLVADITKMEFLMYNVRQQRKACGDRLVAMLDGESVQVFGTTTSAAQSVALWQAIQKLIQERKASYETSLRDIEKYMKRKSLTTSQPPAVQQPSSSKTETDKSVNKSPISLDTDVVVTLKALNLGIFPSTFSDHQVFKLEALNAQARFEASMEEQRIRSILGLTLGQLRIGLAGVRRVEAPKAASEISVEDVVASATGSRGGTILKVPKVEATMQTWQSPASRSIEYIFKSSFEGKVEVGWNYSRISYIRGMWANHSKALAQTWGREIPAMSAIKVTGVPEQPPSEQEGGRSKEDGDMRKQQQQQQQQKIRAEVTVPQSKYEYIAREPPIIETPQLRDMGEATPPLEWIGLHRDRLPNLTHQIVIVSLLELAGEVEDAYAKILGSS
ncbi:translation elongation factor 2 [Hypoxylon texense]